MVLNCSRGRVAISQKTFILQENAADAAIAVTVNQNTLTLRPQLRLRNAI